ncbi:MAG: carboxymethylenebutenolidase [Myxococcota bacterium]|jgi:carboxymethylenebutenolidase
MKTITLTATDGGAIPVTCAEPASPTGAGLLIIPAIFGVDPGILEIAHAVCAAGCPVWIINPFWRSDPSVIPPARFQAALTRARALRPQDVRADVAVAVAALRARAGRVATAGYCFGGPFALAAAVDGPVDATFAFHGSRLDAIQSELSAVRCPVSLHFGSADSATPPELIEALQASLAHNPRVRIHRHPGARHGFAIPNHPGWQADAATAGRADLIATLQAL